MSDEKLLPPDPRRQVEDLLRRVQELERLSGTTVSTGVATPIPPGEPVGTVKWGIYTAAPPGYLLCNGSSTNGFPALQAVLSANGWASTVTPDLRNRFPLGASGSAPLGTTGGAASHTLTIAEMPAHAHFGWATQSFIIDGGTNADVVRDAAADNFQTAASTDFTGGGGAHSIMPPWLSLTPIIRAV